jgi:hypothetical protein
MLTKSIDEWTDIKINSFDNYNPYFSHFSKKNDFYRFATKKTLDRQLSNTEGLISGKIKPIYTKKISFIGEDYNKLVLFKKMKSGFHSLNKEFATLQYDLNSGPNVEVFVSYLVGLISENKLCPSFNYFYFSCYANISCFDYEIEIGSMNEGIMNVIYDLIQDGRASYDVLYKDDEIANADEIAIMNEDEIAIAIANAIANVHEKDRIRLNVMPPIVKPKAEITENLKTQRSQQSTETDNDMLFEDDILLTMKNHPCYLLITEQNDLDFAHLVKTRDAQAIKSVIFQVFSACVIMYNLFSIKNNDLHTGNIMLKKTKKKSLYYKLNSRIYEVPTYGHKAKIIDWGRGTYKIAKNGTYGKLKGKNLIYNNEIYSGFYDYTKDDCFDYKYSDIAIFCHSILNDFHNEEIELINEWKPIAKFLHKFCAGINTNEYNWEIYEEIMKTDKPIIFEDLFKHKFFDCYLTKNGSGHIFNIY